MARISGFLYTVCTTLLLLQGPVPPVVSESVHGLEGWSVTLPCSVPHPGSHDVQWSKFPQTLIATKLTTGKVQVKPGTSWSDAGVTIDDQRNLHISKLNYGRDNGKFVCQTGNETAEVHLAMHHIPKKLYISNRRKIGNQYFMDVTEGRATSISCGSNSTFPHFDFTWTLNGEIQTKSQGRQSCLDLTPARSDSGSILRCKLQYRQYQRGSSYLRTQALLNVLYIDDVSENVSISQQEGRVAVLKSSVLGNPPPSYSWWRLRRGGWVPLSGDSPSYTINSVDKSDTGTYQCRVKNEVGESMTTVELTVTYIDSSEKLSVSELERQSVVLKSSLSGHPPPSYSWWRSPDEILWEDLNEDSTSYTIASLNRSDKGTYECRVWNDAGEAKTTVQLTVEYSPDVAVSFVHRPDHKMLECVADGMPDSYHFWPWEHTLGGARVRQITRTANLGDTNRLRISDDFEDTGLYVCRVENSHGFASASIFYRPQCEPQFQDNTESPYRDCSQTKTHVVVPFYSYPEFTNVTWETDSGEIIHGEPNMTRVQESTDVRVVVHGTRTSVTGQAAVLVLEEDVPRDLVLTVTNSLGSSRVTVTRCRPTGLDWKMLMYLGLGVSLGFTLVLVICVCVWKKHQATKNPPQNSNNDRSPKELTSVSWLSLSESTKDDSMFAL